MASLDSFKSRKKLTVGAKTYEYFSLKSAEKHGLAGISQLPYSMKIVLENLLRNEDGRTVKKGRHRGCRGLARSIAARSNMKSRFAPPAC